MFKELVYTWLFKGLEIVLVMVLGYGLFVLIEGMFNTLTAIVGISIIFYFFGSLFAPYINQLRKWLYAKITGIDEEDFK